jgi:uncharacterized protein
MKQYSRITRRHFSSGLAWLPVIAAVPELARSQAPSAPLGVDPFSLPVVFERNPLASAAQPFRLDDMQLDAGPFRQARDWNIAYLKRLDPDRLLHAFRLNAGIASGVQPLGGWEAPKCELRGHFVGHYLSALAMAQATTGDAALRARGEAMVAALAECQSRLDQGGYLSAFPLEYFHRLEETGKVWAPFYTLHKIMAGLLDMHVLANNPEALRLLIGMAQWVDHWTAARDPARMQQILKVEFGGMSDVLYRLAEVTHDDRHVTVGDRFNQHEFLSPLATQRDQLRGLHANTHIPQLVGAARRYEISSDPRFRHAAEFFWDTVVGSRTYVTGGSSNREHWKALPNQLAPEWRDAPDHQECCCAYNMLKLTRHLFGWRPEARYMDYYERVLLNHRLGTIQPEAGHSMYFLSLAPGAWKTVGLETDTFWCCNGTALEEFAKMGDTIYYQDSEGLWLNLFIASRLTWKERGVEIKQETRFPEEARTSLTIERAPGTAWNLRIRIPGWTSGAQIRINGKRAEVVAAPGSYASIVRKWRKGDRIDVEIPMSLMRESLPDDPSIEAFLYGPLVLAGQFPKGDVPPNGDTMKAPDLRAAPYAVPKLRVGGRATEEWLAPSGESPLRWRTRGIGVDVVLAPLYSSWERYAVYWQTG